MEAMEEGNVDEDELEDLDEKLEIDYQLGEDLKERVSYLKEVYRFSICVAHCGVSLLAVR